ncbi:hypothetical protein SIM13_28700 [Bacillus cereus group sp. BfR-BA-01233]|uniref:hypothetical protein n=2 Tax=unclassified Bacillus cereus group TaxID=2750818 RepID=UPI0029C1F6BE|nr:hypothetical protein [Bacillus cereus group sp. BfR-BA-01233]MDX5846922.1 hypothetical protein [Bacillus cereus group sp. BfR-BA-01233]
MRVNELQNKYRAYAVKMVATLLSALDDKMSAKSVDIRRLPPGYNFKVTLEDIKAEALTELNQMIKTVQAEVIVDKVALMNEEPITDFAKAQYYYQTTRGLLDNMNVDEAFKYLEDMKGVQDLSKFNGVREAVRSRVSRDPLMAAGFNAARIVSLSDTEREDEICKLALGLYEDALISMKNHGEYQLVSFLEDINSNDIGVREKLVDLGLFIDGAHDNVIKGAKVTYGVEIQ